MEGNRLPKLDNTYGYIQIGTVFNKKVKSFNKLTVMDNKLFKTQKNPS